MNPALRGALIALILLGGLLSAVLTTRGLLEPEQKTMTPDQVRDTFRESEARDREAWKRQNPGRKLGPAPPAPPVEEK